MRALTLVVAVLTTCMLAGCGSEPPDSSRNPLVLTIASNAPSFKVGDHAKHTISSTGGIGSIEWAVEKLPANWQQQSLGKSCTLSGPMMLGSTVERQINVTATDEADNTATATVTVVAGQYTKKVPAAFEQICGNPSDEDTFCYICNLERTFVVDPDRGGRWDAWIDTDGLGPGDQLWVFDLYPTEFDSEGTQIPGEVERTKGGELDTGESTERIGSKIAREAIADGHIRIRIKTPTKRSFTITGVEFHVR